MADLVQIGMSVARMVGHAAEAETALAEAAAAVGVVEDVLPIATSLAEAIEADRASAAAAEARRDFVARTEIVAAAFAQVARAIRRTVLLAERMDRGWARPAGADGRSIAPAMGGKRARNADEADATCGTDVYRERLDSLDTLDDIEGRPDHEIIRGICRDLGVDPARMATAPAEPQAGSSFAAPGMPPGGEGRARASPARDGPG